MPLDATQTHELRELVARGGVTRLVQAQVGGRAALLSVGEHLWVDAVPPRQNPQAPFITL